MRLAGGELGLCGPEEGWIGDEVGGREGHRLRGGEHAFLASLAAGAGGEGALVTGGLVPVADRDPRVNRGHHVRDVAHVGGAGADLGVVLGGGAARGAEVVAEAAGDGHVVDEVLVAGARLDIDRDAARQRRAARAALHDRADPGQLREVEGAHGELTRGALGDDVHGLAAVLDVAVHAHAVAEVDPLGVDQVECLHTGSERTRAVPGGDRRVGRLAVKDHVDPHRRERVVRDEIPIERVEHHGRVHPLEDAGVDELDLAAAPLLGRGADELDRAGEGAALLGEREERAERAARDEVVTTRVADLGERVVLREDRDARATLADAGAERGRHAAGAALDLDAAALDGLGEPGGGAVLLEAQLGVGVDLRGDVEQHGR